MPKQAKALTKSLLMMMLQAACALGHPWLNRDVVPVRSFGLYAEDEEDELHRRLNDIRIHYDANFVDLKNMWLAPRVGENSFLALPGGPEGFSPTQLYEALTARCRIFGAQLVIIDTVADVFGGNENNRGEVRSFISLMRKLALSIDGVVILTAHPSQTGLHSGSGMSGSTAWNNSVRSRLYLTRPSGAGPCFLSSRLELHRTLYGCANRTNVVIVRVARCMECTTNH